MKKVKQKIRLKMMGLAPYSVNSMFYKNGGIQAKYKDWRNRMFKELKKITNQKLMKKFREAYENNPIRVRITHLIPRRKFWTEKGEVSLHSKDLTNVEKAPVDVVFDDRFAKRGELTNLSINDKMIVHLDSRKQPAEMRGIIMEIEELNGFYECPSCEFSKLWDELTPYEEVEVEEGHCPDCGYRAEQ
jgi:Holliday junction resolvase RusA-like endonuclease